MRNHEYWVKKDQMKVTARQHTDEMATNYAAEITDCINRTKLYDFTNVAATKGGRIPVCEVLGLDSVSGIFAAKTGQLLMRHIAEQNITKCCVLNFASYKNPGGMFIEGSTAQEESLCHESYLYNVLSSDRLKPGYEYNKTRLNHALYENHAFYTPDVRFFHNGETTRCDVITCAAPNYSAAHRYQHVTPEQNSRVLKDRIKFVLDVMASESVDCAILGAYGCGVFGQDPTEVAQIFKEELTSGAYPFEHAVFAIIPSDVKTLDAFKRVFEQR